VTAEGISFLAGCEDGQWDMTVIDVNAQYPDNPLEAPPEEFVTEEALTLMARVTAEGGIAIINLLCSDSKLFERIIARIQAAFHGTVVTLRDYSEDADENCICFVRNRADVTWPPPNFTLAKRLQAMESTIPSLKPFKLPERLEAQLRVSSK